MTEVSEMINLALFKVELKNSLKLLLIFLAVITMYVIIIISMYDPEMMLMLSTFAEAMPELMAALGMNATITNSLMEFMISYLYGFILLIFPMIFIIIRSNALIAHYNDQGSMVSLLASGVSRGKVVMTQLFVLLCSILIIVGYSTAIEILAALYFFEGELVYSELLYVNAGLLAFQMLIGGICFIASCSFSDSRHSLMAGAGIPILMYVIKMLANVGGKVEKLKYCTIFTLFDPTGLAAKDTPACLLALAMLMGAIVLYAGAIIIFKKRDLSI